VETVAQGDLPAQPVFQLRGRARVELVAVVPRVAEAWIERKSLAQRHRSIQFCVQLFPSHSFCHLPGQAGEHSWRIGREVSLLKAGASEQIERRYFRRDNVIPQAATQDVAQIEMFECIVLEIREAEHKPFSCSRSNLRECPLQSHALSCC